MTTLRSEAAVSNRRNRELAPLISGLQIALQDGPSGLDAAERAATCLLNWSATPDFLSPDEQYGDPERYQQHVLFVDRHSTFSLVALVWRAGQQTAIHDHRCWGAVAVVQGTEHEVLYTSRRRRPGLVRGAEQTYPAGDVSAFAPPGDIHQVDNPGPSTAISLHVYGADISALGSSIRRTYSPALVRAA